MENKNPIKKLFCLTKGDWICEMKFDKKEWCTTGNIDIYQISKDMYELLIEN